MSRTASEQDLYRRVQSLEEELRRNQQGILGGDGIWMFPPVDYAATGNVTLSSAFLSITDVAPGTATLPASGGMRILLWQQTNKNENGIYEVSTDNMLVRANDMLPGALVRPGMSIYVRSGYLYGNQNFFVLGPSESTVDASALAISPPKGAMIFEAYTPPPEASTQTLALGVKTVVTLNAAGTPATISYTPPVDVFLSAWTSVYLQGLNGSSYAYSGPQLNVNDADGIREGASIASGAMNATTAQYQSIQAFKKFKLVAGTAYTISAMVWIPNGTASVYRGGADATFNNYEQHVKVEAKVR